MLSSLTSVFSAVIGWAGSVVSALVTAAGTGTAAGAFYALLPLFLVGIAISIVMVGIKIIRKVVWGN